MVNPSQRFAVIGAGLAGLTLADRLSRAGVSVTVFDKGRGPGGRMSTRTTADGLAFDHGAQYFTVRDPRFERRVEQWIADAVVAEWTGRIGVLCRGECRPVERATRRFVGTPGMNALCLDLAARLEVRSGVTVEGIHQDGDGRWQLTGTDAAELQQREGSGFDWLVSTAPAPQSAVLFAASPELRALAESTRLTGCWAAMLAFAEPLATPLDGAFVEDSPLAWLARNSSKPGRSGAPETWVLHASPEWSEEHLELDRDAALAHLIGAFQAATEVEVEEPLYATAHRWRYALPSEPLESTCLIDEERRLAACGDWCGGPRVEGAFLSGLTLAERLLGD